MTLIDIRPLKKRAPRLPQNVANLILSEPDYIEESSWFAKCEVWFRLLEIEAKITSSRKEGETDVR